MKKKNCLTVKNYLGQDVVFTEEQRLSHESKRPELRDPEYINERVARAIMSPDFVYDDFGHQGKRHAYYLREYCCGARTMYTKVLLAIKSKPLFVVTAFRPDFVKERGRTKLIYGKDE